MAKVSLADFTPDLPREAETRRPAAPGGVRSLPIDEVATNPLNARTEADEDPDELSRLADTIAHRGVLQPIVVCAVAAFVEQYPDQEAALGGASWVTLIGNRRVVATRLAGVDTIRAVVDLTALASIDEVMLVENGQRRDLHPLREAEAMARLRDRDGVSVTDIARRIGFTHGYVSQRLTLLKLIPPLREALDAGTLSVERARKLGTMTEDEQQAVADAGPPWQGIRYGVTSRRTVRSGDPAATARSIRELYSGEQLAELVRLLSEDMAQTRRAQ